MATAPQATRHVLWRAVPLSAAAHAALLVLAVAFAADEATPKSEPAIEMELADVAPNEVEDLASPSDEAGAPAAAGAPGAPNAVARPRPKRARFAAERSQGAELAEVPPLEPQSDPVDPVGVGDVVGDLGDALSSGLGAGGGGPGGTGRGGMGNGRGSGDGANSQPIAKKPPSKARPAILIHPKRTRKIDTERLFVIEVTIDKQGYVEGARLVSGVDPHLNEKALNAIWRFRYRPALDDRGRPIRSKLKQRFMIRW